MVLVTGATGFLGSELVRQLLDKGEKIRALKRESSQIPAILKNESSIEWVNADLLDYYSLEDAIVDITKVYHCAAYISFNKRDKDLMHRVNVEGTANLLNVSMAANIKKFLHVSSVAALGDSKKGELVTEKHNWQFGAGQSGYSVSKYESEMEVFRAAAEGLDVVVINPTIIIGKNAGKTGSGQLFETVRKGLSYYPAGGCGYVSVGDVAETMIQLMESDITGERFIINSGNWTYRDFFTEVATQFNIKPPEIALSPWMLQLARYTAGIIALFSGKNYGLTRDTVRSASKIQTYSNDKIKKTLDLQFKSVKDSIADVCRNFDKN